MSKFHLLIQIYKKTELKVAIMQLQHFLQTI